MILITNDNDLARLNEVGIKDYKYLSDRDMGWLLHQLGEVGDKVIAITKAIEDQTGIKRI